MILTDTDTSNFWHLGTHVEPRPTLQQGDLIRFSECKNSLCKIGIVVTADCDLENKKHANLVTLVPILSARSLLENYIYIEECEGRRNDITAHVCKVLDLDSNLNSVILEGILDARSKDQGASLSDEINLAISFCLNKVEKLSSSEYSSLMRLTGGAAKSGKSLSQKIATKGDLLPLPSAKHLGINENIAWVRHIWQTPMRSIAMRTSETANRPAERIARLASPFRYRLTQKMAQVFSDIGLPTVDHGIDQAVEEALK